MIFRLYKFYVTCNYGYYHRTIKKNHYLLFIPCYITQKSHQHHINHKQKYFVKYKIRLNNSAKIQLNSDKNNINFNLYTNTKKIKQIRLGKMHSNKGAHIEQWGQASVLQKTCPTKLRLN